MVRSRRTCVSSGINGRFALRATLPGATAVDAPLELAESPRVATRVTSLLDLHHLGWHNPVGDVVLLPIALRDQPEWLLAVVGSSDPGLEAELGSLCAIVGTLLDRLASRHAAALTERLAAAVTTVPGNVRAQAAALLRELALVDSASRAALWQVPRGGHPQLLSAWGPSAALPLNFEPGRDLVTSDRIVLTIPAWQRSTAAVDLSAAADSEFTPERVQRARAGTDAIRLWLAGVGAATARDVAETGATSPSFEARIGEEVDRARQFGLSVSLLVVNVATAEAGPDSANAVEELEQELRGQLRAADLIGTIASGDIAMLFTQTDAQGLTAVLQRILRQLETVSGREHFPIVRIGKAVFPAHGESAADLSMQARLGAQLPADTVM